MTVTHIVSFKYGSLVTAAQRTECFKGFFALTTDCGRLGDDGKILPYLRSLVGGDVDEHPQKLHKGFDHTFVGTFANPEDLKEYLVHPTHVAYASFARSLVVAGEGGDILVIDFETQQASL